MRPPNAPLTDDEVIARYFICIAAVCTVMEALFAFAAGMSRPRNAWPNRACLPVPGYHMRMSHVLVTLRGTAASSDS